MGLKDELEKIVANEKIKIAKEIEENETFKEKCKTQFLPLANLLRELEGGIDEQYAKFEIGESEAIIDLKVRSDVVWGVGSWKISCNGDYVRDLSGEISYFEMTDGFILEEMVWFKNITNDPSEFKTFNNEIDLVEYMMRELGKRIAHYAKRIDGK